MVVLMAHCSVDLRVERTVEWMAVKSVDTKVATTVGEWVGKMVDLLVEMLVDWKVDLMVELKGHYSVDL